MRRVGITTTIPVEVLLAAGAVPVDLNNLFISHLEREALISGAENDGFPGNLCAWVKGIYGAALAQGIGEVIGVTRGDCSSTEKLLEVFSLHDIKTVSFSFPGNRSRALLTEEIERLMSYFRVDAEAVNKVWRGLKTVRQKLARLDELTWKERKVSGKENHLWHVSSSDFQGNLRSFESGLQKSIDAAQKREPLNGRIRLGVLGVPTILDDLYETLAQLGGLVVFNEVQRQFAMPYDADDLVDQYLRYTYPYDTFYRLADIELEIARRGLGGVIHYAQTFCHRQIESIVLHRRLKIPVLTIEADRPGPLDSRTRTRLEAFMEMCGEGFRSGSRV